MSDTPELIKGVLVNGQIHKIDYNALENKPNIDGIEKSVNDLESVVSNKQDRLTFDSSPMSSSSNPVTSDGIFNVTMALLSMISSAISRIETNAIHIDTSEIALGTLVSTSSGTVISIPNAITIGSYMYDCDSTDYSATFYSGISLYAPHVQKIYDRAFYSNTLSGSLYLPECTYVGEGAFARCISINSVSLPRCRYIDDNAFARIDNLQTIYLTEVEYVGKAAFMNNSNLTTVNLADYYRTSLVIQDDAFKSCTKLHDINRILYRMSVVESGTFAYTSVSLIGSCWGNMLSISHIGYGAFSECSKLTTVKDLINCSWLAAWAFRNCTSLSSVSLPAAEKIEDEAFGGCTSLSTLSLPKAVHFGSSAFISCKRLISLYLPGSTVVSLYGVSQFYSTPIGGYSTIAGRYGSVYVPSSLYSDYINNSKWASYSARIVSM